MSSDTFKSNQLWYYMPECTPFALLQVHFVWYLCSRYILSQLWTKRHAPHKLNEHWIPQWVGQITNYKLQISNYKRTSLSTRSMQTGFRTFWSLLRWRLSPGSLSSVPAHIHNLCTGSAHHSSTVHLTLLPWSRKVCVLQPDLFEQK